MTKILTISTIIIPNIMQRTTSFIIKAFHKNVVVLLFKSKPINSITNERWWFILGRWLGVLETSFNTHVGVLLLCASLFLGVCYHLGLFFYFFFFSFISVQNFLLNIFQLLYQAFLLQRLHLIIRSWVWLYQLILLWLFFILQELLWIYLLNNMIDIC